MRSDAFEGIPSAPGKLPKRLSNEWFSIMTSITCLMGEEPGTPAADGFACVVVAAAAEVTAVAAASSGTSPAIMKRLYRMRITFRAEGVRLVGY